MLALSVENLCQEAALCHHFTNFNNITITSQAVLEKPAPEIEQKSSVVSPHSGPKRKEQTILSSTAVIEAKVPEAHENGVEESSVDETAIERIVEEKVVEEEILIEQDMTEKISIASPKAPLLANNHHHSKHDKKSDRKSEKKQSRKRDRSDVQCGGHGR